MSDRQRKHVSEAQFQDLVRDYYQAKEPYLELMAKLNPVPREIQGQSRQESETKAGQCFGSTQRHN